MRKAPRIELQTRGAWSPLRRALLTGANQLAAHVEEHIIGASVGPRFDLMGSVKDFPWGDYEDSVMDAWELGSARTFKLARANAFKLTALQVFKRNIPDTGTVSDPAFADELALSFLEAEGLRFAQRLSRQNKKAILDAIEQAITDGWSIQRIVARIRSSVGLLPKDAQALSNREDKLRAAGVPKKRMEVTLNRYKETLISRRAETIAHTEIIRANNVGQQQAWQIMQHEGELPQSGVWRKWIVAPDERLCPICESLGRMAPVEMSQPWMGENLTVMTPPAHPRCRCSMGLVFSR